MTAEERRKKHQLELKEQLHEEAKVCVVLAVDCTLYFFKKLSEMYWTNENYTTWVPVKFREFVNFSCMLQCVARYPTGTSIRPVKVQLKFFVRTKNWGKIKYSEKKYIISASDCLV